MNLSCKRIIESLPSRRQLPALLGGVGNQLDVRADCLFATFPTYDFHEVALVRSHEAQRSGSIVGKTSADRSQTLSFHKRRPLRSRHRKTRVGICLPFTISGRAPRFPRYLALSVYDFKARPRSTRDTFSAA